MQGTAGIRDICAQAWELSTPTGHGAAGAVRRCCRSLTFTDRQALPGHVSLPQAPLVPACRACSSALGTWRRVTMAACAQQLAVPSLHPKQPRHPTAVPANPTAIHLRTGGLRLLGLAGLAPPCRALGACSSWNYIASCVIQSTPHFTPWLHTCGLKYVQFHFKLCSVRGAQMETACTKNCAMHQ